MKIYFVSGFLGSGKTTSIINSAKILMARGLNVGVITNDQGKYLVDNSFVKFSGIPSIEVANGCFCCNYDDFDSHILDLAENQKPDIIFAESVGSCADIVATVMKPILEFRKKHSISSSLTAFSDSRLLRARIHGGRLPFSEDVIYIFDKQIEEADILVINKSDLLTEAEGIQLQNEVKLKYSSKAVLLQSAFNDDELYTWLSLIEETSMNQRTEASIEMDYEKYADGELKMAWLDKVFTLESPVDLAPSIESLFNTINQSLNDEILGTGHLKLFINPSEGEAFKISRTGMDGSDSKPDLPSGIGRKAKIILNARVESSPDKLSDIIHYAISDTCRKDTLLLTSVDENAFRPGIPKPVHRFN
ncbi:MAG TPA: hypothetical protein DCO79_09935 [Spirochaeta sp.]|nr:hypothetical protein [Spirochaeta sp.]